MSHLPLHPARVWPPRSTDCPLAQFRARLASTELVSVERRLPATGSTQLHPSLQRRLHSYRSLQTFKVRILDMPLHFRADFRKRFLLDPTAARGIALTAYEIDDLSLPLKYSL